MFWDCCISGGHTPLKANRWSQIEPVVTNFSTHWVSNWPPSVLGRNLIWAKTMETFERNSESSLQKCKIYKCFGPPGANKQRFRAFTKIFWECLPVLPPRLRASRERPHGQVEIGFSAPFVLSFTMPNLRTYIRLSVSPIWR